MVTLIRGVPCDDSRTRAELGIKARSPEEMLADTLRWMYERGVVSFSDAVGHASNPADFKLRVQNKGLLILFRSGTFFHSH